ncbi:hypothetical protein FY550_02675 [Kushneria phosphatilytica]|uniref:Uncharacterized protein n=1 Tax=Kushneria phosphatilytica TaxID=657387 RepID=A0A5C0ZXQ6_9GAMM|nr:hypothetical protein [Kushneria phosphatilytica]QEL10143.1 hypothetical protein FY550_02675 [Kushneria phosphatilytica]
MADEDAFEALVGRILDARPSLQPLDAVLLAAVIEAENETMSDTRRSSVDTGRLSRRFDIEHALVRRSAAVLEAQGWLSTTPRSGRSPALVLQSRLPDLMKALLMI